MSQAYLTAVFCILLISANSTYRKIKIELKGIPAGATVRVREGCVAPTNRSGKV